LSSQRQQQDIYDVIVVGAGPAGLTAAVYLGRFRRRCLLLEDGQSRARWIPKSHNIPGFAAGISGQAFLSTLTEQALKFGVPLRRAHVSSLRDQEGIFIVHTDKGVLLSRYVLLATGVRDHLPPIEGAEKAVTQSVLRVCPICDGFEAIDQRIAIIGDGAMAEREAEFLRNYSYRVTVLDIGPSSGIRKPPPTGMGRFERININLSQLEIKENRVTLASATGERYFDVAYLALGSTPQHGLARSLGAQCDERDALTVNAHQRTSVPRLYAAGDVVRGLNQVVVAAAEGAIAATDIHNQLRTESKNADASDRRMRLSMTPIANSPGHPPRS
jgi:thioredoxin reductase (NADPH)